MDSIFASRRKSFVLALVLAAHLLGGCVHRGYLDPAFGDRHLWDAREDTAYRHWEGENQIVHIDYRSRSFDEQWAYWNWRHSNPRLAEIFRTSNPR